MPTCIVEINTASKSTTQRGFLLPVNAVIPYPMGGQGFESTLRYLYVGGPKHKAARSIGLSSLARAIQPDRDIGWIIVIYHGFIKCRRPQSLNEDTTGIPQSLYR